MHALIFAAGLADEMEKEFRTVQAYGWPLSTTEAAVRAAFPTAEEVTVVDNGEEEWYLRRASMVFPTAEAAREAADKGGPVVGERLAVEYAGAPITGNSLIILLPTF